MDLKFSYPPKFENDQCPAIWQNPYEWRQLIKLMKFLKVKSVLVLGTSWGMDIKDLRQNKFQARGVDIAPKQKSKLILEDDYRMPRVKNWAGRNDCVMIDGEHSYDATKQAFEMYAYSSRKIVVLHDICANQSMPYPTDEGVKRYWNELRRKFNTLEIKGKIPEDYGIGVVFMGSEH